MATIARMAKRVDLIVLILIVIMAGWLRFYRLGSIPPSLDWDEVSLAYNAESLGKTGKDEFGNSWPLSIQSFNDYKPPVYTYLLIPVLNIFGKTEFAVRFPSALAGTLTVLVTYFLVKELLVVRTLNVERRTLSSQSFKESAHNVQRATYISLLSAFLLTISPWHLQFSRIAFEANAGLFFFVAGMWLLIRAFHKSSQWSLFFSVASMSVALMSYHSLRVVIPLLVLTTLWIYKTEFLVLLRCNLLGLHLKRLHLFLPIILSTILTILTILTISYTIFFQKVGQSRFEKTSFLTIDNLLAVSRDRLDKYGKNPLDKIANVKYFVYARQYIKGYLDHFDLRFWFLDGDRIDRHRAPGVGLLYWWELPFLVMGLMAAKEKAVLFLWLLLAPTASALTGGTPSAVRSLVFLPTFQIFTALGIVKAIQSINIMPLKQKTFFNLLLTAYCLLLTAEVSHYLHQYYIHSPLEYASSWQYGYKQMVGKVMADKDNYKKILITTSYDQPYIYFLWYGNYDPYLWVNDGEFNKRFDKFEFKKIEKSDTQFPDNSLIVGTPLEIPGGNLKWRIDYPDGKAAFLATEK